MSQQTTNRYFDELASGLASGSISRGKALKLMGAALVGGTLASIPGIGAARNLKRPGMKCKENSQCETGVCVEGVCGGLLADKKCHQCPAGCACAVSQGGVIRCIQCDPVCVLNGRNSCGDCGSNEVCIPESSGVACAPACPST